MGYIFQPDVLRKLGRQAAQLPGPIDDKVAYLRMRLDELHPGHVRKDDEWGFNFAGGGMGQMTLLHASLTEYLMVFGTNVGATGFSGRYMVDDYFTILEGEHWVYEEGELDRRVLRPGEVLHTQAGDAHIFRMPDRCYGLDYARGFIPSMLPFGFVDAFTSTLDARTVARTLRIYTKAVVGELLRGKI